MIGGFFDVALLLFAAAFLVVRPRLARGALPASLGRVPLLGRYTPIAPTPAPRRPLVLAPTCVLRSTAALRQALAVARVESRHLLRHPIVLVGALLCLPITGFAPSRVESGENYNLLTASFPVLLYVGVLGYFAANLMTTRARRNDFEEQYDGAPVSAYARVAGMQIAVLALVAVAVVIQGAFALNMALRGVALPRTPSPAELAMLPLGVLGGGLLGIMVGRWARWPGVPLVVMIAIVFLTMGGGDWNGQLLVPYVEVASWNLPLTFVDAHWGWHAAYLGGLDAMAAVGAHVVVRGRWQRTLLAVGAAVTVFTVLAGWLQHP